MPCRNCLKSVCPQGHHDCLLKVEPDAVVRAALELYGLRDSVAPCPAFSTDRLSQPAYA